jgi:mRNA-degrading endonuclease RelE of RelBE toxin-antitoxin system
MWQVVIPKKLDKKLVRKFPRPLLEIFYALIKDISLHGPIRGNWPNYSKLGNNRHHCHLKKGQPTYVAVWEVVDNKIKIVEVVYVGTHEKAPY